MRPSSKQTLHYGGHGYRIEIMMDGLLLAGDFVETTAGHDANASFQTHSHTTKSSCIQLQGPTADLPQHDSVVQTCAHSRCDCCGNIDRSARSRRTNLTLTKGRVGECFRTFQPPRVRIVSAFVTTRECRRSDNVDTVICETYMYLIHRTVRRQGTDDDVRDATASFTAAKSEFRLAYTASRCLASYTLDQLCRPDGAELLTYGNGAFADLNRLHWFDAIVLLAIVDTMGD